MDVGIFLNQNRHGRWTVCGGSLNIMHQGGYTCFMKTFHCTECYARRNASNRHTKTMQRVMEIPL